MPKAVNLGDIVHFQTAEGASPLAAIVIGIYADADTTADLCVFNGYVQGTTNTKKTEQSDEPEAGKFFYPSTVTP